MQGYPNGVWAKKGFAPQLRPFYQRVKTGGLTSQTLSLLGFFWFFDPSYALYQRVKTGGLLSKLEFVFTLWLLVYLPTPSFYPLAFGKPQHS